MFKKFSLKNKITIMSAVTMFVVLLVVTVYAAASFKTVQIIADGETYCASSVKSTVRELLDEQQISVCEYDKVYPMLDSVFEDNSIVTIERAFSVYFTDNGEKKEVLTSAKTIEEFVKERNLVLADMDFFELAMDSEVYPGMEIVLNRIIRTITEEEVVIPYEIEKMTDFSLPKGQIEVIREGQDGSKFVKTEVFKYNGKVISKKILEEKVTKEVVNQQAKYGMMVRNISSRGEDFRYKNMIVCTATAYDLSYESVGTRPGDKGHGITATGTYAQYGTVAVDPRVIPLGSKLYIESTDGSIVYGYCTAEDTGGAIKGNKVDLFYPTNSECMQFGRRAVNVYILE